jgi:hypothetical protein
MQTREQKRVAHEQRKAQHDKLTTLGKITKIQDEMKRGIRPGSSAKELKRLYKLANDEQEAAQQPKKGGK